MLKQLAMPDPAENLGSAPPATLAFVAAKSAIQAQWFWACASLNRRIEILKMFRGLLAEQGFKLAASSAEPRQRAVSESLAAEVIPLADACKFLEREAAKILAPRKPGRHGRPLWLYGVEAEVHREPLGLVLVIAPSNYPLFIPGVQVLQALTAGNAVLIKPSNQGVRAAHALVELLHKAGFDYRLVQVLPDSIEAVRGALDGGVTKVFLTGSASTGAMVQSELAPRLIPSIMELSGCDAVLIRADADLDLAIRALAFGLRLNKGATCIAPRRIFVHQAISSQIEGRLAAALQEERGDNVPLRLNPEVKLALNDALARGAHLVTGKLLPTGDCIPPLVLAGASSSMRLLHLDVFAPVMSLITVSDDLEALENLWQCPYALGATIFTRDEAVARKLAQQIHAGLVVVNDMIVPSADPRIPFGGRGRSGFGVTRGAEGLLEMTTSKVVTIRRTKVLPHLETQRVNDAEIFANYLMAVHARGLGKRFAAMRNLLGLTALRRRRSTLTRLSNT